MAIMRQAESKYTDQQLAGPLLSSASIIQASAVGVGTSDTQRIGDEIEWKTLTIRFTLECPAAIVSATPSVTRMIVFQWHDDNATLSPVLTNILDASRGPTPPVQNYVHDYVGGQKVFTVLLDRTYSINNYGVGCLSRTVVLNQRAGGTKKVRFLAGSSNTGLQQLYIMFVSDQGTGASPPLLSFASRLEFTDS